MAARLPLHDPGRRRRDRACGTAVALTVCNAMFDELTAPIRLGFERSLRGTVQPHAKSRPAARPAPRTDWLRVVRLTLLLMIAVYAAGFSARAYIRKYSTFLTDYARWMASGAAPLFAPGPVHVFVLFTDHFEPDYDEPRVAAWTSRYAAMASRHQDRAGRRPQHTFFYPGEQPSDPIMRLLESTVAAGLGEVELHFHHQYDTEATLRAQLEAAIARFQRYGFLQTVRGDTRFAFLHGNSGLDNSNGDENCGVNTEIGMLRRLGAFADYTFPSLFEDSQPRFVNSIYAVRDDDRPKSYDRRLPLSALGAGAADLMIFEGPLIFSPR